MPPLHITSSWVCSVSALTSSHSATWLAMKGPSTVRRISAQTPWQRRPGTRASSSWPDSPQVSTGAPPHESTVARCPLRTAACGCDRRMRLPTFPAAAQHAVRTQRSTRVVNWQCGETFAGLPQCWGEAASGEWPHALGHGALVAVDQSPTQRDIPFIQAALSSVGLESELADTII
jgi:hypothetical protein